MSSSRIASILYGPLASKTGRVIRTVRGALGNDHLVIATGGQFILKLPELGGRILVFRNGALNISAPKLLIFQWLKRAFPRYDPRAFR